MQSSHFSYDQILEIWREKGRIPRFETIMYPEKSESNNTESSNPESR